MGISDGRCNDEGKIEMSKIDDWLKPGAIVPSQF